MQQTAQFDTRDFPSSSWARSQIQLPVGRVSAFRLMGLAGLVLALSIASGLAVVQGLSVVVVGLMLAGTALGFFGSALLEKGLRGSAQITYYHQLAAMLLVVAGLLLAFNLPLLPYMDLLALGIGATLITGRFGCLMAGCCHGKPHPWGVCYGREHFTPHYTPTYPGVPLFPVQVLEALLALVLVAAGSAMVLAPSPAGSVLAFYLVGYALGRFLLEFLRGDPLRRYWLGFSEAQWTSLGYLAAIYGAWLTGLLPVRGWALLPLAATVLMMAAVTIYRRLWAGHDQRLTLPGHLWEVAHITNDLLNLPPVTTKGAVRVGQTSAGLRISGEVIAEPGGPLTYLYVFSSSPAELSEPTARILAEFLCRVRHPRQEGELRIRHWGVFHLLVQPNDSPGGSTV